LAAGWLPKTWKELSSEGDEKQMSIKVAHISPLIRADKKMITASALIESRGNYSKVARGVNVPHGMMLENPKEFYDTMQMMARQGLLPGFSESRVLKLRKDLTELRAPEDCDFAATLIVAFCGDKETAMRNLDMMVAVSTGGFGAMQIPGGGDLASVFDNPMVRAQMTPEQAAQIEEFKKRLPGIDAQVKAAYASSGMKVSKETLLGYPAVSQECKGKKCYASMVVGNYIVSGDFLMSLQLFPPGSTECDSLTRFKSVITKEKIGSEVFTTEEMVPLKSTLAEEWYLNKDEFEQILKNVTDAVLKNPNFRK